MKIDMQAFIASLRTMGEGMLGIFAVMAVIIAVIEVLNRLTGSRGKGETKT